MLTVTQRCDSCGRRVPADQTCATCAPGPAAVFSVLSRAAALWLAVMVAAAAFVELL